MDRVLVLTGTIAPNINVAGSLNIPYGGTKNPIEREKQYYKAIRYYIEKSEFTTIIFCDNSNYDFSYAESLYKIAKKLGKTLELLKFKGDNFLNTQISYGAGEAEILDYVYDSSKYLKKHKTRCKVTGRYIIDNINEVIAKIDKVDCFFNKYGIRTTPFHVATGFFKISNEIYREYIYRKQIPAFLLVKKYDNSMLQLEQVRYLLLRDYILDVYIYRKPKNIPVVFHHRFYNKNRFLLFIFKICIHLGFLDFNRLYKYLDAGFLSRQKIEIIEKLKSNGNYHKD